MICISLTKDGSTIFNTFPSGFDVSCLNKNEKGESYQYIKEDREIGTLEIFVLNDENKSAERFIRSNKNFSSLVQVIDGLMSTLSKNLRENTEEALDEYLHNIVKIHGNQKSIVERFTYFEKPKESYTDFVESVKNNIIENTTQFAKDICELSKEIKFMDYQIGGYRLLNDKNTEKSVTKQNLRRFLLGLSHQFFKDFSVADIYIELYRIDWDVFCLFEYETFNIAMHNFLQNAVKYAKPGSRIHVTTINEKQQLVFSMDSVKIERDEILKIYEKGRYGKHAPENLKGDGIGMNTLKKALERSNVQLIIDPEYSNNSTYNNVEYVRNVFRFIFPKTNYIVV